MSAKRTGPLVLAVLLTVAQPAVWLYLVGALFASDGCESTDTTGICDVDNQLLAVAVPFIACTLAVGVAWLLIAHTATRWQVWGTVACVLVSVAALRYSWILVSDLPVPPGFRTVG